MTDSQFSVICTIFLAILCVIAGYAVAMVTHQKVECESVLYSDTHEKHVYLRECEL